MSFGGSSGLKVGGIIGGGVGGIIGGAIGAGNDAANAQRWAARDAADRLRAGGQQAISYLNPYANFGKQALSPLSALLTGQKYDPETGQSTQLSDEDRMSSFLKSPGYQFRLGQGLSSIEKSANAQGQSLSGGKYKALNDYSQGVATDEYGNYVQSLFQQAGMGQQAATNQGNYAIGTAAGVANYDYQGGMANANKYANLSNFGFQLAGAAASAGMGGMGGMGGAAAASRGGNAGRYNSAYNLQLPGGQ